jgi:hypothetical protein
MQERADKETRAMGYAATMVDTENKNAALGGSVITVQPSSQDESERNPIFDALVTSEGEVAGLVAYSLYKQNKRSWLDDFIKLTGRTPSEAETRAYIIGESTERRLATYRQLAAVTLGAPPARSAGVAALGRTGGLTTAVWALVALLALGLLGFGLHALNVTGK